LWRQRFVAITCQETFCVKTHCGKRLVGKHFLGNSFVGKLCVSAPKKIKDLSRMNIYLRVSICERICLIGGTAYHLAQTRHWWDSFPPGPRWDLVNLSISSSSPTLPKYINTRSFSPLNFSSLW